MLRSFSRKAALAVVVFLVLLSPLSLLEAAARAKVIAHIDLSTQRMTVTVNGRHYGTWPVSTARRGYRTPRGTFRPKFLKRMHYSRKYYNSPMPWSVFFLGGYAIHGTNAISRLGRPASHGCIRLHPASAREFFRLVREHGRAHTRIRISRSAPPRRAARAPVARGGKNLMLARRKNHHGNGRRMINDRIVIIGGVSSSSDATGLRVISFD